MNMKPRMPLGEFLVAYLRRMGVTHLFGLPGDLVLGLFQSLAREKALEIVTFSHDFSTLITREPFVPSTTLPVIVAFRQNSARKKAPIREPTIWLSLKMTSRDF